MDSNSYQSLAEAYQSIYSSQEDVENLNENITGASLRLKTPLGAGVNKTSGIGAGVQGGSGTTKGSADAALTRTTDRVQATPAKTAVDDALSNYNTGAAIPKTKQLPDKIGVSVDANLSGGSAPKPKPAAPVAAKPKPTKPKPKPKDTKDRPEDKLSPQDMLKPIAPKNPTPPRAAETPKPAPVARREPMVNAARAAAAAPAPVVRREPAVAAAPVVRQQPPAVGRDAMVARNIQRARQPQPQMSSYEMDAYNLVLEYLLDEGFASTEQAADKIILNMSEAWFEDIMEGHPGYKAGSKDHGPMQAGHPADGPKRSAKGGTMSMRHGYHLGDMDDEDEDEDELESIVKQQSRDSRERTRKPLRDKVKATRKKITKEDLDQLELIGEEEYDRAKDKHLEHGGMAARKDYDRPPAKKLSNKELGIKPGKTMAQKEMEKKYGKGATAMDIVMAQIRAKHGKDAIKDVSKKKKGKKD